MPRPGATMASATLLSSARFIVPSLLLVRAKSMRSHSARRERADYPRHVISRRNVATVAWWQSAQSVIYVAMQHLILRCSNQSRRRALGPVPEQGATRAQTRTDDLGAGALSPPLVDAAAEHAARRRGASRASSAHSSHRADRLRFQSRRVADVHLRAEEAPAAPALVVVLHGCTQSAASYDLGAGWSTLAERYGFVLLLPEQTQANNPKTCFNWFLPGDTARDRGEALSIRQMIEKTIGAHGVDRSARVRHRALGRRRDDGRDAGDLSGGVRRGRDHRGTALWHRGQCAAGVREHVSGAAAHRARNGAIWCGAPRRIAVPGRASRSGMAIATRP